MPLVMYCIVLQLKNDNVCHGLENNVQLFIRCLLLFISVINVEYLEVSPDIYPKPHTGRPTPYSHRTCITWGPSVVCNDCKSAMSVICQVKNKLPTIFYETQWSRDNIRHVRMDMLVI